MNQTCQTSIQAILKAVKAGLSPLKTEIPQTAVEWCDQHFYLPEGSSQIPGQWKTQPVQFALLNMMGNDAIKEFTLQKPTRFGYTKMLAGAIWYLGVHKKRSAVIYQPNEDLAKRFAVDEMNPLLPVVPAIQAVFPDWNINNENNTIKKKVCTGFSFDILGAESPNNFRAMTKQVVVGDEMSAWKVNSGEGDNVKNLRKRTQGAAFAKAIFGSTVTISGDIIERLLDEADCVFQFHLPCPHCGHEQMLEWGSKETDHGIKWDQSKTTIEEAAQSSHYVCANHSCRQSPSQGKVYYKSLIKMEEAGKWVCEKTGIYTHDGIQFYSAAGSKVSAPKRVGIKVSALYSLNLTEGWVEIVREWLDIRGDADKLQSFWNLVLGLHWQPANTKRLDYKILLDKRIPYKAPIPDDVVYLVAGGDTQDNRMEAFVWGVTADNRKYLIDRLYRMGDPRDRDVQDTVVEFCNREYTNSLGRTLKIARICWDIGGHRTEVVYALSKRIGLLRFIPVRGANAYQRPIQDFPSKINKSSGTFLTQVGTDTAKDQFYADIEIPMGENRAIYLPLDDRICDENVCKQLVSEIRVPKKTARGVIFVYDNEGRRNEALDCFVYALAALQISIEKFGLNLAEQATKTEQTKISFSELGKKLGAA
ncbi:terminase gpA endonuclease subunit [Pseudoalteromonas ulvae]|uniref:terminase gpA endonuclease subunit n=1 Tax=Pseudoalteromonas ulvae TaxID=107327 RepID=UPI0015933BA0|nr:terminase gpA endonuclease subunit [Pseudoalteromonas ulvae]